MGGAASRYDGCKAAEEEMYSGIGNEICLELGHVDVEAALKAKWYGKRGDDLGD